MFDIIRNNQKLVQIILGIILLPFAFFGVDSFFRNSGVSNRDAATVGDKSITLPEYQKALNEQRGRLQATLGAQASAMLESPEVKAAVLDELIQRRLLERYAEKERLAVTDQELAKLITSHPSLQENGSFSQQRYEALIANKGVSKEFFEYDLRQNMKVQQPWIAVAAGSIAGKAPADHWLKTQMEEREISEAVLRPEQFLNGIKISPDAIKTYYETNQQKFELPEQVRAEYVILSLENLAQAEQVTPDEVTKGVEASGFAATWEQARSKAQTLQAELKKNPKRFADLARENSEDPGSKDKGGDLGFFGRGMMVKPFEDAVFKMKIGDISNIVESDFGFHIISLTAIRQGGKGEERQASHILLAKPKGAKNLETMQAEIAAKLKREKAAKKFAAMSESFRDTVFEQADSLTPAADKFQLKVQQSGWLVKGQNGLGPFSNPKLSAALFSEDALKNQRNTEAIEVAPNVMVAARVLEHKPAQLQSLEIVSPSVEKLLAYQEAEKRAAQAGQDKLEKMAKGEKLDLAWTAPHTITRSQAANLSPEAIKTIFHANTGKLPTFVGAPSVGGSFTIYRISKVNSFVAEAEEKPQVSVLRNQYARVVGEQELRAWMISLRSQFPVAINKSALESEK